MAAKTLKVGLIGLGYIGKIHATAYRNIPLCFGEAPVVPELTAVLRSRVDTEEALTREIGFALVSQDREEFFRQPLDLVDICTPNFLHKEQIEEALNRGLPVYCEKPLAKDLQEARAAAELAKQTGALTHVAFVLRYLPAIRQMKALIEAGEIGEVFNCRAHMFHSGYLDTERPMSWRLRWAGSGGGALSDLGSHLIDLVHYLLGEAAWVRAFTRTLIPERPTARGSSQRERVDVDDWAHCVLELKTGAMCALEVTRMAAGAGEATSLEVFGSRGALAFHIHEPESVRHYDLRKSRWSQGAIDVPPAAGERPIAQLWPSGKYSQGLMVNAHLAAAYDFLQCVAEGTPSAVDFEAGLSVQEILEAAYLSAARGGERIALPL